MKDPLLISITFDTDYDYYYTPKKEYSQVKMKEDMLSWSSMEEGIPIINDKLRCFSDSYGNEICFTWFLLSDNRQMEKNQDYTFIYKKYKHFWKDLINKGDELGLHVHLIEKSNDLWVQCIDDNKNLNTLRELISAWEHLINFKSIRFGYCYQSNRIMNFVNNAGFFIDSSALPRRKVDGPQYFDWEETPEHPYHPSKQNYKVPSEDNLDILEVPFSIFKSKLKDDKNPVYRYINLSFHPFILKKEFERIVKTKKILNIVTHFFEFIPRFNLSNKKNLLIAFNSEVLVNNLKNLINTCVKLNRPYKFVRISEYTNYFS